MNKGTAEQAINFALDGVTTSDIVDVIEQWHDGSIVDNQDYQEWLSKQPSAPDEAITQAMWGGLARDMIMWHDINDRPTPEALFSHLRLVGRPAPEWLKNEPEMKHLDHVPSKGTRAVLIYKAMLKAAPQKFPDSDAAVQIAEAAFRAGYEACARESGKDMGSYYGAWSEYQPSDDIVSLVK